MRRNWIQNVIQSIDNFLGENVEEINHSGENFGEMPVR